MHFLLKYYRPFVHTLIWTILFTLNIGYFASIKGVGVAFERGLLVLALYLIVFYINWFLLVPDLYIRQKYLLFLLATLTLLILTAFCRIFIERHFQLLSTLAVRPLAGGRAIRHFALAFSLSAFIFLISFILRITDYYHSQSRQKDALIQQKTEAEFKLLTAQLNPHFLFNALNNIYALVLTKSEKAPGSLMSLSQLLRYIIYETNVEKVSLQTEIMYLKHYIELEALRLNNQARLKLEIDDIQEDTRQIMPLIFIPFVENAFKHSNINRGGFIYISLQTTKNGLVFRCDNSTPTTKNSVDKVGGVGLGNTRKRLLMAYSGSHELTISNQFNLFSVLLNIQL